MQIDMFSTDVHIDVQKNDAHHHIFNKCKKKKTKEIFKRNITTQLSACTILQYKLNLIIVLDRLAELSVLLVFLPNKNILLFCRLILLYDFIHVQMFTVDVAFTIITYFLFAVLDDIFLNNFSIVFLNFTMMFIVISGVQSIFVVCVLILFMNKVYIL